jgi:hypothetical protein
MMYLIDDLTRRVKIKHVVIIWIAVNLASAFFSLLYADEAYYIMFSKQLDYGYFDHPPMIALMIRLGQFILNNELGVRLLAVISVSAALYFTYKLADVQNPILFLTAIFSILGLNILGFLALPDSPLLLFAVLFFMVYKRFLYKETILNSILLGVIVSAMLYSKYQGILIIFFTVISNLNLFKSRLYWLAVTVSILLFIPHLVWQFNNDFVSASYHLIERMPSHYKFSFTVEYLIGQILYYGPFTTIFMFIAALKFKYYSLFEKALFWNLWGIIGFFLLNSLRGRIEVNWTLPILIPLLIFFLRYSVTKPVFTRWFYISAVPVIVLISLLRLEIVYPISKLNIDRLNDFRGHKELGKEIIEKSKGLPVIVNSYQMAGLVSFYTNTFVPSICVNSRRNQFNLWHAADSLRFKKVAYVDNYLDEGIKIQNPYYSNYKITIIDSLPVMNDIRISTRLSKLSFSPKENMQIKADLFTEKGPENYRDAGIYSTRLYACLYKDDDPLIEKVCLMPIDQLLEKNKGACNFQFDAPAEKGEYQILISLKTSGLGCWNTTKTVNLTVN